MEFRHFIIVSVLAMASLLSFSCSSNKALRKQDIQIALGDLRTFAASSRFLSEQFQQGHITNTFYTRQADLILEKVQDTGKQLDAPASENEVSREKALRLTTALEGRLTGMSHGATAIDDINALGQLATEAKALEDRLKLGS